MLTEETMFSRVRERLPAPSDKAALEEIAVGSGIPYHTLLKIAKGETADPRVSTFELLVRYYRERDAGSTPAPAKEAA